MNKIAITQQQLNVILIAIEHGYGCRKQGLTLDQAKQDAASFYAIENKNDCTKS